MRCEIEYIDCPFCHSAKYTPWAIENGYTAVRCKVCGLLYVNPRPASWVISEAVRTGMHRDVGHGRTVIGVRANRKIAYYRKLLIQMFPDVWQASEPISWLDVGAGYGEMLEAIGSLAPIGSKVVGLEPMQPKARAARARGLNVQQGYLSDLTDKYQFLSLINVFSHIPDFRAFLNQAKLVLRRHGGILVETGNTADVSDKNEVPGDLDLPDHLVFAGERHLRGYLTEAGFTVVELRRIRVDGILRCAKNVIKRFIGRENIPIKLPYTSRYRSLLIRARLDA